MCINKCCTIVIHIYIYTITIIMYRILSFRGTKMRPCVHSRATEAVLQIRNLSAGCPREQLHEAWRLKNCQGGSRISIDHHVVTQYSPMKNCGFTRGVCWSGLPHYSMIVPNEELLGPINVALLIVNTPVSRLFFRAKKKEPFFIVLRFHGHIFHWRWLEGTDCCVLSLLKMCNLVPGGPWLGITKTCSAYFCWRSVDPPWVGETNLIRIRRNQF